MAEQKSSILVGVFEDMAQAEHAYHDLRAAGYGDDHLGLADPRGDDSGVGKNLAQAGVPEGDSRFYEREFQAGHPLVTIRVGGLQQEAIQKAITILKKNGAYDAKSGPDHREFGSQVKKDAPTPFFDIAPGKGESE